MTTRHKLLATRKNQVSLARSLTPADAAADAAVGAEGLFELSVCPSITALASVAQATVNKLAVTAHNMGWYARADPIPGVDRRQHHHLPTARPERGAPVDRRDCPQAPRRGTAASREDRRWQQNRQCSASKPEDG